MRIWRAARGVEKGWWRDAAKLSKKLVETAESIYTRFNHDC